MILVWQSILCRDHVRPIALGPSVVPRARVNSSKGPVHACSEPKISTRNRRRWGGSLSAAVAVTVPPRGEAPKTRNQILYVYYAFSTTIPEIVLTKVMKS